MKTCSKCRKELPLGAFYRNPHSGDGLRSGCKLCAREYYEANRDKIAERGRKYREASRGEIAERKRDYYEANRDKIADREREYYEANQDRIIERCRDYRRAVAIQVNGRIRSENATSIGKATHHRQPWSTAEDLIASRTDLTRKEAAFMLGRSIASITTRRRKLRSNATPSTDRKAGAA